MRGIPDTIATAEDIRNIAFDLPPADSETFLAGVTPDDLARCGMTQTDFVALKAQVGDIKFKEKAAADKRLAVDLAIAEAETQLAQAEADFKTAEAAAIEASETYKKAVAQGEKNVIEKQRLVEANQRIQDQAEQIQAEAEQLHTQAERLLDETVTLEIRAEAERDRLLGTLADTAGIDRQIEETAAEVVAAQCDFDKQQQAAGDAARRIGDTTVELGRLRQQRVDL